MSHPHACAAPQGVNLLTTELKKLSIMQTVWLRIEGLVLARLPGRNLSAARACDMATGAKTLVRALGPPRQLYFFGGEAEDACVNHLALPLDLCLEASHTRWSLLPPRINAVCLGLRYDLPCRGTDCAVVQRLPDGRIAGIDHSGSFAGLVVGDGLTHRFETRGASGSHAFDGF